MFRLSFLLKSCAPLAPFLLLIVGLHPAMGAHSAFVVMGYDPYPVPFYAGTSSPPGVSQVNVIGNNAGFLNGLSGGSNDGETGNVGIMDAAFTAPGATELVAAAIHVTDTAGPSHSLSADDDPALADIVNDLNNPGLVGVFTPTVYPFDDLPENYVSAAAALTRGESANGGQPFDLLVAITDNFPSFPFSTQYWAFDFSNEVGQLDGITSLQVTDVGAVSGPVPEPTAISLLVPAGLLLLKRRARR